MQQHNEAVELSSPANAKVEHLVRSHIRSKEPSESFLVLDTTKAKKLYNTWRQRLPRVQPCYAVSCNSDAVLLRTLAKIGASFACISEREVKMAMKQGIAASKIIMANPCQHPNEIVGVRELGVGLTTFDTITELEKFSKHAPDVKAMLTIRVDNTEGTSPFEFGAEMDELPGLYGKAKDVGIDVVGVRFNLGRRVMDTTALTNAVSIARVALDLGRDHGFKMSLLDIGDGFESGDPDGEFSKFKTMAEVLNTSLDLHFPPRYGVTIMAEPGRFFVETCVILAANIIGVRDRNFAGVARRDYWITEGIDGCFNPMAMEHLRFNIFPLRLREGQEWRFLIGSLFGPSSKGADVVIENALLPELFPDDWLLFYNMGAYTSNRSHYKGMNEEKQTIYINA